MFEEARTWYAKYERRITTGALLFGFVFDFLTLSRVDRLYENLVLLFYLLVAGAGITLLALSEGGKLKSAFWGGVPKVVPAVIQFAFGALFSGFVVFYSKSASLLTSAPFLLVLAGLFIGNEFLREKYQRLSFHLSIFFLALFSFAIFFVPILFNTFGPGTFIASGVIALAIVLVIVRVLARIEPERVGRARRGLFVGIGGIYMLMHVFYFTNLIPPIPLSLKDVGVYHDVVRTAPGVYQVEAEELHWYDRFDPYPEFHMEGVRDTAYVFSSVFAPADIETDIRHRWEFFNEEASAWEPRGEVAFGISGGRAEGYRGYTFNTNIVPGRWRVYVETVRGQVLGRIVFNAVESENPPAHVIEMR